MPESAGWTRFFKKKDLTGEDFFGKFLDSIARIFEGGDEAETMRQIRAELVKAFDCDDISLFAYDPGEVPGPTDGEWVLRVKSGFGEGNSVSQGDARGLPDLMPGRPVAFTEELAQKAALKAIALAFEEDGYYGCDIEKKKIVLVENPRPEDDLGSGDLSVLAIPLRYHNRVGRVLEQTRVGVLALFKTPVRRELAELEGPLRSILAHAIVSPSCTLKDPVTGLFTERFLREELDRQLGLFDMTQGKLRGGFVVGMIDTLKLYKQTLQTSGNVDPEEVGQKVSDVLRGVGHCVWERCRKHALGDGEEYRSGYPGRLGEEGFAVILPLLQPNELCMWAVRLAKSIKSFHFESEELLATGDITASLRVIPFRKGSADELWKLAHKIIEGIAAEQNKARRVPEDLAKAVAQIRVFSKGRWLTTGEFVSELHI